MKRRGIPKGPVIWYLREWMAAKNVKKQSEMMDLTGWSKAKMSQLYNFQQDFNSQILIEAANALHIAPYELLMTPAEANALKRFHENALQIAAEKKVPFSPPPPERDGTHG